MAAASAPDTKSNQQTLDDCEFLACIYKIRDTTPDYRTTLADVKSQQAFLTKVGDIDKSIIAKVWCTADNANIKQELLEEWMEQIHGTNPITFLMKLDIVTRRDLCKYLGEINYQPMSYKHNNVYEFIKWISNNHSYHFMLNHFGKDADNQCQAINKVKGNVIKYYYSLSEADQSKLVTGYNKQMADFGNSFKKF